MKKCIITVCAVALSTWLLAPAANAQQMFLESSDGFQKVETCDTMHHVESCDNYHITVHGSSGIDIGTTILLNDLQVRIDWAGEGFKLANGTIISKQSGNWTQIWPSMGPVQVSGWQDADNNSYLTVSDQVTVNGTAVAVEDHRYFIWVTQMQ